jgi:trehalose 6-phosphate synthase
LKKLAGNRLKIAHFWHGPWPNRETFRVFPWKEELLDGLLGNDLLGFHLRYHCQNFLDTCDRMIEAKVDHERFEIVRGGETTTIRPFPISIDFARNEKLAGDPRVERAMERWRKRLRLRDQALGLGIERLDYTKGIPDRLMGLEAFFERHPEWRHRFVFLQVAVPSRTHIPRYQKEEEDVRRLVERINWKWGNNHCKPVVLIEEHQDQVEMIALHRLAAFMIVSSLHDGMNLVAKEFVASREDELGVLILSRFTGAFREMPEALPINPFATHEYADAILKALTMPEKEQNDRMKRMRQNLAYHNVYRWAAIILFTLFHMEFPDKEDTLI